MFYKIIILIILLLLTYITYLNPQITTSSQSIETSSNDNDNKPSPDSTTNEQSPNTGHTLEYTYMKRKKFQEKWQTISQHKNKEDFSWQFLNNVQKKLQQVSSEDKQILKDIQGELKSLSIKYDHDTNSVLKYDNITINN